VSFKKETIGDVVELITNGVNCKQNKEGNGVKISRIETIANREINYQKTGFSKLTEADKNKYKLIKGDILFSHINSPIHVGKVAIYNGSEDLYHGVNLLKIRVKNHINPYYFKYFLDEVFENGYWRRTSKQSVNQASVNQTDIKKIDFLYPILSEQQRIVAKLDVAFAEIDKVINISKKKIIYIENIYESFLTSLYEKCKSAHNYQEKFFGDIIETLTDYHANGSYKTLKKHVELKNEKDFAYMVRSTDFEKNFTNNKRYISKNAYEFMTKTKVFGGEIIMSKIGNAGKVYLMPEISYPCSLAMNLFLIRLDKNQSSNEFIYNFLKSKSGKIQISQRIKGATTQTITKENVRSIKVPHVKKELQKKIVSKIYIMRENINIIKKSYIKKLDLLFQLKRALIMDLIHS
jgi:type I restriction enzyme, S subunit